MNCALCGKPASKEHDLWARIEATIDGRKRDMSRLEHAACAKAVEGTTTSRLWHAWLDKL